MYLCIISYLKNKLTMRENLLKIPEIPKILKKFVMKKYKDYLVLQTLIHFFKNRCLNIHAIFAVLLTLSLLTTFRTHELSLEGRYNKLSNSGYSLFS